MSSDKEICTLCEGTGFDCDYRCDDCNGSGEVSTEFMSSEKKKYKVYIDWETEVEAKDHGEALTKGNDDFYFSYSHIDEAMSLIRVEEIKNDK